MNTTMWWQVTRAYTCKSCEKTAKGRPLALVFAINSALRYHFPSQVSTALRKWSYHLSTSFRLFSDASDVRQWGDFNLKRSSSSLFFLFCLIHILFLISYMSFLHMMRREAWWCCWRKIESTEDEMHTYITLDGISLLCALYSSVIILQPILHSSQSLICFTVFLWLIKTCFPHKTLWITSLLLSKIPLYIV